MKLEIVTDKNDKEYLTQKSKEVNPEEITKERIKSIIKGMTELLYAQIGIGIAAPQCRIPGEKENLQLRMFIIDLDVEYERDDDGKFTGKVKKKGNPKVYINPKISNASKDKIFLGRGEGCLSCPGERVPVERNTSFTIKYLDREGKERIERIDGKKDKGKNKLLTICIQHEFDHLEGKLIRDKSTDKFKKVIDPETKKETWELKKKEKQRSFE